MEFFAPTGFLLRNTKTFVKNQKLKISKIQNSIFVRTTEKKIQKMFETF